MSCHSSGMVCSHRRISVGLHDKANHRRMIGLSSIRWETLTTNLHACGYIVSLKVPKVYKGLPFSMDESSVSITTERITLGLHPDSEKGYELPIKGLFAPSLATLLSQHTDPQVEMLPSTNMIKGPGPPLQASSHSSKDGWLYSSPWIPCTDAMESEC